MITAEDGESIATAFDLGPNPVLTGPVAHGEVGRVWRLVTETATWAVREAFEPPSASAEEHDASMQERAAAAGVTVPAVRRTVDRRVLADLAGSPTRVYSWVELSAPTRWLDPVAVGASVGRCPARSSTSAAPPQTRALLNGCQPRVACWNSWCRGTETRAMRH